MAGAKGDEVVFARADHFEPDGFEGGPAVVLAHDVFEEGGPGGFAELEAQVQGFEVGGRGDEVAEVAGFEAGVAVAQFDAGPGVVEVGAADGEVEF